MEISNVSKTFPVVKALNNVRFDIRNGEVHSLVGENGAGKAYGADVLADLESGRGQVDVIKILSGFQPPAH